MNKLSLILTASSLLWSLTSYGSEREDDVDQPILSARTVALAASQPEQNLVCSGQAEIELLGEEHQQSLVLVLCGLHHTFKSESIKVNLLDHGHKAIGATG